MNQPKMIEEGVEGEEARSEGVRLNSNGSIQAHSMML
jgi:hypothetical protein